MRVNPIVARLVLAAILFGGGARAQEVIHSAEFRPLNGMEAARNAADKPCLLGDRFEYAPEDVNGQFYAILAMPKEDPAAKPATTPEARRMEELLRLNRLKAWSCRVRVSVEGGAAVAEKKVDDVTGPKLVFLVHTAALKPGKYVAQAVLLDGQGAEIAPAQEFKFTRSDKKAIVSAIPVEGIPIVLEAQSILADAAWPVRMGVPLPVNAVTDAARLALFENGAQVPAQVQTTALWCPKGSAEWVLVDFIAHYTGGKPAEYRLKLLPAAAPAPKSSLRVEEGAEKIRVDTGAVRFEVSRKKYAGIETAWYDPTGAGKYDESNPVIKGPGGPYLVDGRIIRFDALFDEKPTVVVEEKGPARVTIRATGWYTNPEKRVDPLCMYITRISAYAGEPMLRISQSTVLTYDTRTNWLSDLGFHIATTGERFRLGVDGAMKGGNLPAAPATVFLHQDRSDHFRLVGADKAPIEGKTADGWFAVRAAKPNSPEVAVILRDIWQKFPKEVEMSATGLTLHFWPKHGQRAFTLAEELARKNIYKFWCFHQGPMLNLTLPMDYYEKFATDYAADTFECRPEHALNGNAQGLVIANEFALNFALLKDPADLPARAKLFQRDPAAMATPEWNAATNAMGRVAAAARKNFTAMEEAVEKGYLSHTRCIERGNEYGMFNYADTHTYWDTKNDCAQLHRVWHNSHYHEMGKTWLMYYRTGSPDLLRWARASNDHWMNVDTINYAAPNSGLKGHVPGAMYHCKGLTHWGGEAYGMMRRDTHSGLWGHWVDPDAFLWSWYVDGNPRAKEVYDLWAESLMQRGGLPLTGTRREINTSLACVVNYYQAAWDADALPYIHSLGLSLRTAEPLEKQQPGPMWHPLWVNRYYELTRDPEYKEFILKYARMTGIENTWTLALGALAYDLSGDKSYLTAHLGSINSFPNKFYHAPGDLYDWYGAGPGPLGSSWAYMQWGYMLRALQAAGITSPTPEKAPGAYPWTPPKLVVLALKPQDRAFTFTAKANSFGGDLHPTNFIMTSPAGKQAVVHQFKGGGPSSINVPIPVAADGETGLYRIEVSSHEANVARPLTDLPAEAALIPNGKRLACQQMGNYVLPVGNAADPVEVTVDSNSDWGPCNYFISDAAGKVLAQGSLFRPRPNKEAVFTLDPRQHKLPWKIETYGMTGIKLAGKCEAFLMADAPEMLKTIADNMPATVK